ncbi:hypothetical protein C8R43DRAFT_1155871 [Mycena crocata]|nr:hypothetical protein C8R43DRAFT_1155831 [Mycena crocata]KAJ7169270.1 hypothetical protein C8R43DRAFT_1155871 [Mycena crocata]
MPPKAQLREQDFNYNADRSEVQCKVCGTGSWIAVASAAKHVKYPAHVKSAQLAADESRRLERLERDRQATSSISLPNIQVATKESALADTASASHARSEAESEMWRDFEENGAQFSAGDASEDTRTRHEQLRKEADSFGFWDPEAVARGLGFGDPDVAGQILAEDEEDDFLSEIMRNAGIEEPQPHEIQSDAACGAARHSKYFPYPTKMMFLLDTIDNLPRLRISGSMMRTFLWVLREAQCKDVPSFDHLRRVQKSIRAQCGIPTIPCKSVQGNVFFMNDPTAIIAQDWANPTTRKHIHVYPEVPADGIIREIWHAQKWRRNMDLDILSPMWDAGSDLHYYVNEISRLRSGEFVIPIRWVMVENKVHADAFSVTFNEQGEGVVNDNETILVSSDDFSQNFLDLQFTNEVPKWAAASVMYGDSSRMPNPKRVLAGGNPLYCSLVDYFGDDVSGNRTKSWNKHWNAYMTHRNLPRQLLGQEFHTHFISTSPNASVTEQYGAFKTAIEATHSNPVRVQDEHGKTTCLCVYCNSGPSDNPMQSEICGHIGAKGNRFCRKCEAGGTQKVKATNDGYHALFEPGIPRTKEKTLDELENQILLACSGVAQTVTDEQKRTGVKDMYTQYWIDQLISRFKDMKKNDPTRSNADIRDELVQWTRENQEKIYSGFLTTKGFDPTRDTPVEILHTILLGIVKYIWHISHTPWSAKKKETYALRLQSTTTDGLSIHAIRAKYIMQYAGSLIGRQFKTIVQTNVFHVHGLVTDYQFMAWKATGELAALLWVPEIRDLAQYRSDLKIAVANVLDIFAMIDPSKIITKIKYHLLVHVDDDVVEFGPLIGVMTEIFECFNAIFRYCSILSNHLAPSRDITVQLADQEGLKHRLTGGLWPQVNSDEWVKAGPGVREFMAKHPLLQKLLGWTENKVLVHGAVKLVPLARGQKERVKHTLQNTNASLASNFPLYDAQSRWKKCRLVNSESLDECFIGSWVFAESATDSNTTITGRISEIWQGENSSVLVVLEKFQILSSRDKVFGMPVLVRSETIYTILPAKNLKFKFNVQHDCCSAKCEATGERLRMQERVESDKVEYYIVHKPLDRYIINTHAFHNAHLLRATLPRDLIAPIPIFEDRKSKHYELAIELRATRDGKRAKKRKEREDMDADEEARPKKRARTRRPPTAGRNILQAESMVATRSRRKVKPSAKAKALEEASDEEEEEDVEEEEMAGNDSEDDGLYEDSDDDYSD